MPEVKELRCWDCGRTKAWRDGFPDSHVATCWQCAWDQHIHNAHPLRVWKIRRRAKRRARRLGAVAIAEAMWENERNQVLGLERLRGDDA